MSQQELSKLIKAASDKMRADDNTKGTAKYLEHFSWLLFLKVFEQVEDERVLVAEVDGHQYKSLIQSPYRWSDWALGQFTGTALTSFVTDKLLPNLRGLRGREGGAKIAELFEGVSTVMKSGYVLAEVLEIVDKIEFRSAEDYHAMTVVYETLLAQMGNDSGWSGEFYTPRPLIEFMVDVIQPQIGETIMDPCSGSGGFLVAAYEYIRGLARTTRDSNFIQRDALHGRDSGEFPYVLALMNLLLHGVTEPDVLRSNSLERDIRTISSSEQYDVILTNPPFGGSEHPQVQQNFPLKSSSTQLLFMQLIMASLHSKGRLAVVLPESFLSNDGVFRTFRERLLREWRVHTIVSVPAKGIWYKDVKTDLLFVDGPGPTEDILYVEIQPPVGAKNFGRVRRPLTREALDPYLLLVRERKESDNSWLVKVEEFPEDLDMRPRRPEGESLLTLQDAAERITRVESDLPGVGDNLARLKGALTDLRTGEDSGLPLVPMSSFLVPDRQKISVQDDREYKRLRVAFHGKGVFLRDQVFGRTIKTKTQYQVGGGQLVVAEIDARFGGLGLVPHDLDGAIVSSHYFAFTIDEAVCRLGWLDLIAQSNYLTRLFAAKGATNYASVRPDDFLALTVPLPDPQEQDTLLDLIVAAAQASEAAGRISTEMATVLQEFRLGALAGRLSS